MAVKINRPRPANRLGLTSDVRSGDYDKRIKEAVKRGLKSRKPPKARGGLPRRDAP